MYVIDYRNLVILDSGLLVVGLILMALKRLEWNLRLKPRSTARRAMTAGEGRFSNALQALSVQHHQSHVPVTITVYFNYNGHSFEAFEVLGLRAGCTWDQVETAFQAASSNESSRSFLEAAVIALREHFRRQRR